MNNEFDNKELENNGNMTGDTFSERPEEELREESAAPVEEETAQFAPEASPEEAARRTVEWQRRYEREYAAVEKEAGEKAAEAGAEQRTEIPRPGANAYSRPAYGAGYQPRPDTGNAPDYRSAYGVRYDPYDGHRIDPRETGRPGYDPYAREERNAGVHTYVNNGAAQRGAYSAPAYRYAEKPAEKKKEKKGVSRRAMAWMIALCIILSAAFGAGGVYVGYKLTGSENVNSKEYGRIDYTNGNTSVQADGTIAAAAAIAADTVVEITTEMVSTSSFFGQYVQSGAGSGVVISEDGHIITCAHVVDGATSITVRLTNGDSFQAKVLGSDSRTDIAVLKIDATGLPAAKIGDSDKVVVGQSAIAIGNPLGTLGGTVTSGIISTLNREIKIDGQTYTLLQLDASINPGNSGGGLFDINGNLIGIVNAKSSGSSLSATTIEGLGFAIPINQAIEVADQLSEKGYVGGRVNLGVYVVEVNSNTSTTDLYNSGYSDLLSYINEYGIYFVKYQTGQNGDFQYGDRIIAIDGTSVSTRSDVQDVLQGHSIGDTVTVTVSRMNTDKRRAQIVEVTLNLVEYVPDSASGSEGGK